MAAIQRPALPLVRLPALRSGRGLLFAAAALLIGVALLQVNQFSAVTSTGYEIEQLERQRAERQAANRETEAEIARLSSLARVDIEARVRLKMEPAKRILYMGVNVPVPDHQTLPTRYLPADEAATEAGASVTAWRRLLDLLPF